jgi:hypothetical protein
MDDGRSGRRRDLHRDDDRPGCGLVKTQPLPKCGWSTNLRSLGSSGLAARSGHQDAGSAACRQRAAAFIDGARAAMEDGNVTAAVTAAEGALSEADEAAAPGIVEIIEPARALLAQVLSAYVGPMRGVPVLAPGANEN